MCSNKGSVHAVVSCEVTVQVVWTWTTTLEGTLGWWWPEPTYIDGRCLGQRDLQCMHFGYCSCALCYWSTQQWLLRCPMRTRMTSPTNWTDQVRKPTKSTPSTIPTKSKQHFPHYPQSISIPEYLHDHSSLFLLFSLLLIYRHYSGQCICSLPCIGQLLVRDCSWECACYGLK